MTDEELTDEELEAAPVNPDDDAPPIVLFPSDTKRGAFVLRAALAVVLFPMVARTLLRRARRAFVAWCSAAWWRVRGLPGLRGGWRCELCLEARPRRTRALCRTCWAGMGGAEWSARAT